MKLAVAGKGGVGKTTITVWLGDYLARKGEDVWLVDADTSLSLGPALGLTQQEVPVPLVQKKEIIQERVGTGVFINMNPKVDDLPAGLAKEVRGMQLLVMGTIAGAGGGCGCAANALLKALLAHLIVRTTQWLLVDLEAGVEHLGRGTISSVDGLIVVSEPSIRSLNTAAQISSLAADLGLKQQGLVLNRAEDGIHIPEDIQLPPLLTQFPAFDSLAKQQQKTSSVLDLPEQQTIDAACYKILQAFNQDDQ